jgi:hypothetical protein
VLAEVEDECGQLSVEDWLFRVDDFGVVVVVGVVAGLVVVAVLPVGLAGVELCVAAIAAPLPTVRPSVSVASKRVRFGLRIAPPFLVSRDIPASKQPAIRAI